MSFFQSVQSLLRPYWHWVAIILIALAIQTGFRVFVPVGFQLIFDRAIAASDLSFLLALLALYIAFWLLQAGMSIVQDKLSTRTGLLAINELRLRMFRHLSRISPGYLARNTSGDLITRFSIDVATVEEALVKSVYILLFSGLNLLVSTLLLFYWEWRLALLAMLGIGVA